MCPTLSSINNFSDKIHNPFESKIIKFYNELSKVSIKTGLGNNIVFGHIYDGPSIERFFTIHAPNNLNMKEKYDYEEKINKHMEHFSKEENLFDIYKDVYILIE